MCSFPNRAFLSIFGVRCKQPVLYFAAGGPGFGLPTLRFSLSGIGEGLVHHVGGRHENMQLAESKCEPVFRGRSLEGYLIF